MRNTLVNLPHSTRRVTFRSLLDAMSRPGRVVDCSALPGPLAFHILDSTLLPSDAFHISAEIDRGGEIEVALQRRTGARPGPIEASVNVALPLSRLRDMACLLSRGVLEYPDQGATAVVMVERVSGEPVPGAEGAIELTGPGIPLPLTCWIAGFDSASVEAVAKTNSSFPLGVDFVFADEAGCLISLPRSTHVRSV